jgi:hypothetical protein
MSNWAIPAIVAAASVFCASLVDHQRHAMSDWEWCRPSATTAGHGSSSGHLATGSPSVPGYCAVLPLRQPHQVGDLLEAGPGAGPLPLDVT